MGFYPQPREPENSAFLRGNSGVYAVGLRAKAMVRLFTTSAADRPIIGSFPRFGSMLWHERLSLSSMTLAPRFWQSISQETQPLVFCPLTHCGDG